MNKFRAYPNNNLSKVLQYVHYAGNPFDFNNYNEKTGFHRITDNLSYKNAPNGMSVDYANIEVIRGAESDTLAMVIYQYNSSTVWYRSSNNANWASTTWNQFVTKSDLNNASNKLMLDGMKTLSVKWTNSDTLEFYVDNTRVFGILAKWSENYS